MKKSFVEKEYKDGYNKIKIICSKCHEDITTIYVITCMFEEKTLLCQKCFGVKQVKK